MDAGVDADPATAGVVRQFKGREMTSRAAGPTGTRAVGGAKACREPAASRPHTPQVGVAAADKHGVLGCVGSDCACCLELSCDALQQQRPHGSSHTHRLSRAQQQESGTGDVVELLVSPMA